MTKDIPPSFTRYSTKLHADKQIITDKSRIFYFVLKFAEIKNSYTVRTQTLPEIIRLNQRYQRAIKFLSCAKLLLYQQSLFI